MNTMNEIAMKGAIAERLHARLARLLQGGHEEMRSFVIETSQLLARAAAEGREDLIGAIKDQMRVRAEALRIDAAQEAWDEFGAIVSDLIAVPLRLAARSQEAE